MEGRCDLKTSAGGVHSDSLPHSAPAAFHSPRCPFAYPPPIPTALTACWVLAEAGRPAVSSLSDSPGRALLATVQPFSHVLLFVENS